MLGIILIYGLSFALGALACYAYLRYTKGGWLRLPQNANLVLTLDRAGCGHFWVLEEPPTSVPTKSGVGSGLVSLDPKSSIWLPKQKCHLFLHYVDFFKTVPPKVAAAMSHFKEKKGELEKATDKDLESIERQNENQPEEGVYFDLRDMMDWVRGIDQGQILEGAISFAVKYTGLAEKLFGGKGKFGWKWLLIIILVIVGIFFAFMFLGGGR